MAQANKQLFDQNCVANPFSDLYQFVVWIIYPLGWGKSEHLSTTICPQKGLLLTYTLILKYRKAERGRDVLTNSS